MIKFAFVGPMHAGKTTAANYLVKNYEARRLSFAQPVKEATAAMLTTLLNTIGPEPIDEFNPPLRRGDTITVQYIEKNKNHPAIRKLLQLVGTELARGWIGPEDIWINVMREKVEAAEDDLKLKVVTVDDCRFVNEAKALRQMGFRIVRVERPDTDRILSIGTAILKQHPKLSQEEIDTRVVEALNHISETEGKHIVPHDTVQNADLPLLYYQIDKLVKTWTHEWTNGFQSLEQEIIRWQGEGGTD